MESTMNPAKNLSDQENIVPTISQANSIAEHIKEESIEPKLEIEKICRKRTISSQSHESSSTHSSSSCEPPPAKKQMAQPTCKECGIESSSAVGVEFPDEGCEDAEVILLTHDALQPALDGKVDERASVDGLPNLSISEAKFFCSKNHLCKIDCGLIEKDKLVYMQGLVTPWSDIASEGVFCQKSTSVNEWFLTGFGSKDLYLCVTTEFANYRILSVAKEYEPYLENLLNVCHYTNHLLRCVMDVGNQSLDDVIGSFPFEGSMKHLLKQPSMSDLIDNAKFIHEQVLNFLLEPYEDGSNDAQLLHQECYTEFCDLADLKVGKKVKKPESRVLKRVEKVQMSNKATTTPMVHEVFSHIFEHQMQSHGNKSKIALEASSTDVDQLLKAHFQSSLGDKREYIFGPDVGGCERDLVVRSVKIVGNTKKTSNELHLSPGTFVGFEHSKQVMVGKIELSRPYIGQVQYLTRNSKGNQGTAHLQVFMKGYESILEDMADTQEVFGTDICVEVPLKHVQCILPIVHMTEFDDMKNSKNKFYYQMKHDVSSGAFTSLPRIEEMVRKETFYHNCSTCEAEKEKELRKHVLPRKYGFEFGGESYCVGSSVLTCDLDLGDHDDAVEPKEPEELDPSIYTEAFRKDKSRRNDVFFKPLEICQIVAINYKQIEDGGKCKPENVHLTVRMLRRPSDTDVKNPGNYCPHLLFYTNEVFEISASDVLGQVYVAYEGNVFDKLSWLEAGPKRFYIIKEFFLQNDSFGELPAEAKKLLGAFDIETGEPMCPPNYPKPEKLKTLDLFAGCGGMSLGFHNGGLCDSKWALEYDKNAAEAYKLNFKNATVFNDDINKWFADVLKGKKVNEQNQKYPERGEVEMICGGPPCQGFSSMNRFSEGDAARFKNSLVAVYFSNIDYFKPKYFVFENVKNFAINSQNIYLKSALVCCLKMGYQVRYTVMQAGNYGIPQSRQRTIILGARADQKLPEFPKITHTINQAAFSLSVNGRQIEDGTTYRETRFKRAPFRGIHAADAILDLPDIPCGDKENRRGYLAPCSIYQQKMRKHTKKLKDHITRHLAPLDKARIKLIPTNGDWRDLPNSEVRLEDGSKTFALKYLKKDGMTGICPCNFQTKEGKKEVKCVKEKGKNSLIPWCLPHTADRHAQWRGLYGRVKLFGHFATTVTAPEPMGKQGVVLHPKFHRCFSVKEFARSQGIPDHFVLNGNIWNKYRQVGNAVPPPLAESLARCFV